MIQCACGYLFKNEKDICPECAEYFYDGYEDEYQEGDENLLNYFVEHDDVD